MALDEIKKQIVLLTQGMKALNATDQPEALRFLYECISSLDQNYENYNIGWYPCDRSMSPPADVLDISNYLPVKRDEMPSELSWRWSGERSSSPKWNGWKKFQDVQREVLDRVLHENDENETPMNLVTHKENPVDMVKRSRRKQMFTRKSVRAAPEKTVQVGVKCPLCSAVFSTDGKLHSHLKEYGKGSLSCRVCRAYFKSPYDFWVHKTNEKCVPREELQCAQCGMRFRLRRHLIKHVQGHLENNCRYCPKTFSCWPKYREHLRQEHQEVKIERDLIPCRFCSKGFSRHQRLYRHYKEQHSKGKFVCLMCGLFLPTKEKYKEHTNQHESEKKWECRICEEKFFTRSSLTSHVKNHESGLYECLTCRVTVTSKVKLRKHQKDGHLTKGLEPKFECDLCHRKFKKNSILLLHKSRHTKDKSFYCDSCNISFTTRDSYVKHCKRSSHKAKAKCPPVQESKYEKVYEDKLVCETCGKQYNTSYQLRNHLRVHKYMYACELCGKSFAMKCNLKRHLNLHYNTIKTICELCGETFQQGYSLKEHMLMKHSDERPETCTVCQKTFKRKSELKRHTKSHSSERPYNCFCGLSYKQSAHLRTHYRNAHGKPSDKKDATKLGYPTDNGSLLSLGNLDQDQDYILKSEEFLHQPYDQMDAISYADLQPAVDLSMVGISEVVAGCQDMEESLKSAREHEPLTVENSSTIQLLSEHIVQEYLLNLP